MFGPSFPTVTYSGPSPFRYRRPSYPRAFTRSTRATRAGSSGYTEVMSFIGRQFTGHRKHPFMSGRNGSKRSESRASTHTVSWLFFVAIAQIWRDGLYRNGVPRSWRIFPTPVFMNWRAMSRFVVGTFAGSAKSRRWMFFATIAFRFIEPIFAPPPPRAWRDFGPAITPEIFTPLSPARVIVTIARSRSNVPLKSTEIRRRMSTWSNPFSLRNDGK